jgi:hypothetical protein
MTRTFLDGAAILGTLEAFDSRNAERASTWALRSSLETTALLLTVPHVCLSPIPELHAAPSGPYGKTLSLLAEFVDQQRAPLPIQKRALRTTQRWALRNSPRLAAVLGELRGDESHRAWLAWLERNQWHDHVHRHGGLFEEAFLRPISTVLDVRVDELRAIRSDHAVDLARVETRPPLSERDEIVRQAFTLSTLLRGRYYESLSRVLENHVLHHPLRYPVLTRIPPQRNTELRLSNTAWFLSTIVVSSAFHSRRRARPAEWVSGIRSARTQIAQGLVDIREKDSDEMALTLAARSAARLGLQTHPAWVDHVLNAAASTGLGGISSLVVSGLDAVAIGFGTSLVLESTSAIGRVTRRVSSRERRLEEIARLGAGRITPQWQLDR